MTVCARHFVLIAAALVTVALSGGCGKVLFAAGFNQDSVGSTPSLSPPENPSGDAIVILGPLSLVEVINSAPLNSRATELTRGSSNNEMGMECVPIGGPYTSGQYMAQYEAATLTSGPEMTVSLVSSGGAALVSIETKQGQVRVKADGQEQLLPLSYSSTDKLFFWLRLNMDAQTFFVTVNNMTQSNKVSSNTFTLAGGGSLDFARLRFAFPAAILDATPAEFVVDDIVIRQTKIGSTIMRAPAGGGGYTTGS